MGMKAPVTGGGENREVPPQGRYLGICNGVYLLGTQPGYNGGAPKVNIMLTFELHKRRGPARDSGGRILQSDMILNFSANPEATLVAVAGALRGKLYSKEELDALKKEGGFDVETMLGLCGWVEVVHKDNGKDKVASVSMLDPEEDTRPEPETDFVYWDWTLGVEPPKRIAYFWDRAKENPGRKAGGNELAGVGASARPADNDDDSDIPF